MHFTDEQRELAAVAADLFADLAASRRDVWDGGESTNGWERLAALGLTGIGIPEEFGGIGGGLQDLVLVCEEAGRAALTEPLVESVVVAGPVLARFGDDEARTTWLSAMAEGAAIATLHVDTETAVVDADRADVLVSVTTEDELVVSQTGDVVHRRVQSEDLGRRTFRVSDAVGRSVRAPGVRAFALARARVGTAAVLNGVNRRLVEMAVAHAKVREQFGQPIGAFQAVQHRLADLHVAVDSTRATAWAAAAAVDRGDDDAPRRAAVAKAKAATTSALVNVEALQVLGGIGFTWEHDLHLWLKRGKALEPMYGHPRDLHRALGRHLLEHLT